MFDLLFYRFRFTLAFVMGKTTDPQFISVGPTQNVWSPPLTFIIIFVWSPLLIFMVLFVWSPQVHFYRWGGCQ